MDDTTALSISNFLDLFPNTIRNNVEILQAPPGGTIAFHISVNPKIKIFEPRVSRRTMNKEDRSVPRVSAAATLNGCLSGYAAAVYDWEGVAAGWAGGWKIYALTYDIALKPNKKILGDAESTEEIWLVGYDKEHRVYPAVPMGEVFFTSIGRQTTGDKNRPRKTTVTAYIRVGEGYTLPLNKTTLLRSGFYQITYNDYYQAMDLRNPQDIIVKPISSSAYAEFKKLDAGLLSY
ncbi:hypothetical protein AH06_177 [Erwinia phage AH06]|nr:hypothetical protein AH06_177 [Erwinia phage AH06]